MIRKIAAIVIGAFVAIALIATVQYVGHQVYPPPASGDIADRAAMEAYATMVPTGALLFVGIAWMVGAFGGGILATVIAQDAAAMNCSIVGGLVLAGTVMTLLSIPHPLWFSITSTIALVATIYVTCKIAASLVTDNAVEQNAT